MKEAYSRMLKVVVAMLVPAVILFFVGIVVGVPMYITGSEVVGGSIFFACLIAACGLIFMFLKSVSKINKECNDLYKGV